MLNDPLSHASVPTCMGLSIVPRDLTPTISRFFFEKVDFLGIDVPKESSDTIECCITTNNKRADIAFQAFEKKDFIAFNVYHTGNNKSKLIVDGKIKDGKIVDKTLGMEREMNILSEFTRVSLISFVPLGNYIWLVFELMQKLFAKPVALWKELADHFTGEEKK